MIRLIISVLGLLACSSTVAAQQNPYGGGTRLTGPPPAEIPRSPVSEEDKGRIVTERLAACLIKARRGSVLKALQLDPWQPRAHEMLVRAVSERCLESGTLTVPPHLLRGAFFQQLYREKYPDGPPSLLAKPLNISVGDVGSLNEDQKTAIAMRQFGECVVRRDLQDSHALVLATPGSPKESAAVNALMPHFSACVTRGFTWTLNRSSVSAILSEVLYREGMAATTAAEGGKN